MATKVSKLGGLIKVDSGVQVQYINSRALEVEFTGYNTVRLDSQFLEISIEIAFTDFQDGEGASINTEETIVVYLDSLI